MKEISENYVKYQSIGEGSFGKIYIGKQKNTNKIVAIKKLKLYVYKKLEHLSYQKEIEQHKLLKNEKNIINLIDLV